jgi:hypothetical protein
MVKGKRIDRRSSHWPQHRILGPCEDEGVDLGMTKKDSRRKWMWLCLLGIGALQLYAVREILAAFALFALGFGAIAIFIASLYLLQKTWEAGVALVVASQHPAILAARRSVAAIEDLARRPIRRPGSEPAR